MKTTGGGSAEEPNKSSLTKVSKKSTKSRSKNAKLQDTSSKNAAPVVGLVSGATVGSLPATPTLVNLAATPTTPTTSLGNYNLFDASFAVAGHTAGVEAAANANANRVVSGLDYLQA